MVDNFDKEGDQKDDGRLVCKSDERSFHRHLEIHRTGTAGGVVIPHSVPKGGRIYEKTVTGWTVDEEVNKDSSKSRAIDWETENDKAVGIRESERTIADEVRVEYFLFTQRYI